MYQGGCTAAPNSPKAVTDRPPEVDREMAALEISINQLEKNVTALFDKIGPVLANVPTAASVPGCEKVQPDTLTILGNIIRKQQLMVMDLSDRVVSVTQRVEV